MTIDAPESREALAKYLRLLGHPDRLNIAVVLHGQPLTVTELETRTLISQPYLSQHLAILRKARILTSTRTARSVTYQVNGGLSEYVISALFRASQL